MKGPEMLTGPLVTQFEPAVVAQPGLRLLYHIAGLTQAAAMRAAARGQQAHDHQAHQQLDDIHKAVASVSLQCSRFLSPLTLAVGQHRQLLEHRFDQRVVALIGWPDTHQQGSAFGITDHVPLAAWLGAISRVRTGVRPPFRARTEALSIMTRRMSRPPCLLSSRNNMRWTLSQTPAKLHSWNRRQQELELTPISLGSSRQEMPPRNKYRIPSRHLRSSQRGRPPLGDGGWEGNCALTASQSSSERSAFMTGIPVDPPSVNFHDSTILRL